MKQDSAVCARPTSRIFGSMRSVRLALDTASEYTLIDPGILDGLGYSPRDGEAITVIRSAVGREPGHLLTVERITFDSVAPERAARITAR